MVQRLSQFLTLAAVAVLLAAAIGGPAQAQTRTSDANDLFYNYYTEPGYGGVSAEMYLSPRPTPPLVGHTYITYQPLMPHEFLYPHHRTYCRTNPNGGTTKTSVRWFYDPLVAKKAAVAKKHGSNTVYPKHF